MAQAPETEKQHRQRGKPFAPLLLIVALCAATALLLPMRHALVVENLRTDKTLLVLPISAGESFSIRYIHSVNLSPVTDSLEWTGTVLVLRSTCFTSFGAGMPVLSDGIGTSFENTEEGFLLSGIDKVQTDNCIPIMLQTVPDHCLLYRGEEIRLRALTGGNAYIAARVRRVSIMETILYSKY